MSKNSTLNVKVTMKPEVAQPKADDNRFSLVLILVIIFGALFLILCVLIIVIWRLEKWCFTKTKYNVDEAKEKERENEEILFTQYAEVRKTFENNDGYNEDSVSDDEKEAEEEHEVNMDISNEYENFEIEEENGRESETGNGNGNHDNDTDQDNSDDNSDVVIETYVTSSVEGDDPNLF